MLRLSRLFPQPPAACRNTESGVFQSNHANYVDITKSENALNFGNLKSFHDFNKE